MTQEAAVLLATRSLKKQAMTPGAIAMGSGTNMAGPTQVPGMQQMPPIIQQIEQTPQSQTNTTMTGMNPIGNTPQGAMTTNITNNTLSDPNKSKAEVPPVPKMQMTPQTTAVMAKTPVYDNGAVKKTAEELVDSLLHKRAYGGAGNSRSARKVKRNKYVKNIKKKASESPETPENAMTRVDEAVNVMTKEAAEKFQLPPYRDFEDEKKPTEYGAFTKDVQKQLEPTQEHVAGMAEKLNTMDKSLSSVNKDSAAIRQQVKDLIGVTKGLGTAAADPKVVQSAIPGPVAGAIAGGGTGLLLTRLLKKNPSLTNYLTGAGIGTGLGILSSFAAKKYAKNLMTNINDSMAATASQQGANDE